MICCSQMQVLSVSKQCYIKLYICIVVDTKSQYLVVLSLHLATEDWIVIAPDVDKRQDSITGISLAWKASLML